MATIVTAVSDDYLEVEVVDPHLALRIAQLLGVSSENVCKVSVNFLRNGLTAEEFYENFKERGERELRQSGTQTDIFDDR